MPTDRQVLCLFDKNKINFRYFLLFFLFSDYMNSRCQSYDVDTNTRTGRQKLEKDSIVNYFEKICLRGGI